MAPNRTRLEVEMDGAYGKDMMDRWSSEFLRFRGMEHGPGWIGLVTTLHWRLRFLVGDYQIFQIKEKFGGLRYYCDAEGTIPEGLPDTVYLRDTVRRLIEDAEHRSQTICEVCGHAGTLTTGKWWKTRCGSCRDQEDAEQKSNSSEG